MGVRKVALAAAALVALSAAGAGAQEQAPEGGGGSPPPKVVRAKSLEPVVVTSTRTPVPAGGVAGSIDVVSPEQLEATSAPDVKTALGLVPTLVINDVGGAGGVATVTMRGATAQQVLVLLDGHRLATAQSSWFNLNDLPLPAGRIARIEVLPVPASALYGADALGGVVNIISKPVGTTPELQLSLGNGTHNEWRTTAGAQFGLGNIGLRFDGQLHTGDGYRENGDFDSKSFVGSARLAPAPWGLELSWQSLDRTEGVPGPAAFPSPSARERDKRQGLRADVSYVATSGWDFRAGGATSTQNLDFNDPAPPSFDPAVPALPVASSHENRSHGADFQWDLDTGSGEVYTVGGEWVVDRILSTNDGDHETDRWGLYAQDQWRAGDWSSVGAIRRDEHSVYGGQTSPSLSVMWSPSGWRVWAGLARGYRAPNFDDLYWNEQFLKGNPDLKPESSWSWEGGVEKAWGSLGHARATYFTRTVKDLIQWVDKNGDFVYSPENVASALVRGYEVELAWTPTAGLSIPIGYQAVKATDEDTGERLPGVVHSLWRMAALYAGKSYSWSLEWARTDRGAFQYKPGSWNYDVLNAAAAWTGKLGRIPVRASVRLDNLQDKAYETVEGYPMPGRTVFAEVGIRL
jgi:outer membrane cobalamin receptor